jgi:hypothetical protein
MSFKQFVIAVTFLGVFAMALRISIDTDTWWQLRTGEQIVETRSIPKIDTYSFTRQGEPWLYPSAAWMSEVQLYSLARGFGLGALNVWVALLATAAFALIYTRLSGGLILRMAATFLAAAAAAVFWAARPYMWSFVFSALFIWILDQERWGGRRWLLWLPAIMLLWVNSHPGFAVGFILLAIYLVDRLFTWQDGYWRPRHGLNLRRKDLAAAWHGWGQRFALAAGGMLAAACVNPAGPRMLRYPFDTVSIGVLRDVIQEWQSPDFHQGNVLPFAVLLLAMLAVLAISRKRIAISDLLLVLVFGGMSLLAARNIALFALVAPIVLTRHAEPVITEARKKFGFGGAKDKPFKGQSALHVVMLAALVAAVGYKASLVLPASALQPALDAAAPSGAVEFMRREQPNGAMFNSYNWGGYLIWNLREQLVFVDGRTDLYGDGLLSEWLSIANAEDGWQRKLDGWDVKLVLLEPTWALSKVLPAQGWHLLYQDDVSVLYSKP